MRNWFYYKELAHMIMEAGMVSQKSGDPKGADGACELRRQ